MGLPARTTATSSRAAPPGAPPTGKPGTSTKDPKAPKKQAVLEVTRSDNGDATYRLLIDGVPQKLKASAAKWDDASPWGSGNYGAQYSPLHGRSDAFLIEWPANRSAIKFHNGTVTGHSEGCIVTAPGNIAEIEDVLADNDIEKNDLRFDVKGDFPIGFSLAAQTPPAILKPGDTLTLLLSLTGGGAPGGVSKDVWFHIKSSGLAYSIDYAPAKSETLPTYHADTSYPTPAKGFWVLLAAGERTKTIDITIKDPSKPKPAHAPPAGRPSLGVPPVAPATPTNAAAAPPAAAKAVTFEIDNYRIVNRSRGKAPYFYTPSDFRLVLGTTAKTAELKAAIPAPAPGRQPGAR